MKLGWGSYQHSASFIARNGRGAFWGDAARSGRGRGKSGLSIDDVLNVWPLNEKMYAFGTI